MTKVLVKTGSQEKGGEHRSASVSIDGKQIGSVLIPDQRPEWEYIRSSEGDQHWAWCYAVYNLPVGSTVEFKATATGQEDRIKSFQVAEVEPLDPDWLNVEGYSFGNEKEGGGWMRRL